MSALFENVQEVPLRVSCTTCGFVLLDSHIRVQYSGEIQADAFIIDSIALVCPNCLATIKNAEDDLSRAVGLLLEEGDG